MRRARRHAEPREGARRSPRSRRRDVDRHAGRRAWTNVDAGACCARSIGSMRCPTCRSSPASWAEWLYFNGRRPTPRRFYLTFMVGPQRPPGMRSGRRASAARPRRSRPRITSRPATSTSRRCWRAPDLDIARQPRRVSMACSYVSISIAATGGDRTGRLTLDRRPAGRAAGRDSAARAAGVSGYVVPVMSGSWRRSSMIGGDRASTSTGRRLSRSQLGILARRPWQWGQVPGGGLSFIYGRVFPPSDVAAADRMPGFLGVLDDHGLIGVATNVSIVEHRAEGNASAPAQAIDVTARGSAVDVRLSFTADRTVRRPVSITGGQADFLQLGGTYRVQGTAGGRTINLSARGAAETFQQR